MRNGKANACLCVVETGRNLLCIKAVVVAKIYKHTLILNVEPSMHINLPIKKSRKKSKE